jgi:GNAT superfamily N-acetyltransferase
LPALVELARADGARFLGIAVVPGEPVREPLAEADGFVRRATNMALPLDRQIGDPGALELRPMTQDEFDAYITGSTEQYIGELAAAGMTEAAAREQGERQMAELVPDGLESPGQSFFTAVADDTPVGTLWISTEDAMAFVYDVEVHEEQRRKGYGEAIMNAGARWCRDLGHPALGLNVFGHNPGARALYDKLGYQVTKDYRSIDLDAGRG